MILLLVIFMLISFFFFLLFIAHRMTKPKRNIGDWNPDDFDIEYSEVSFETEDGVDLKGWWMDKNSDKTLICLHGYTASRWYEIYMRPLLNILKDKHYNILYFDLRAHGRSGGNRTSFGLKEHLDLKASLDWLEKKHEESCKKIGLIGYSMGAVVAVKCLVSDERVDCAVADSPPIDMDSTSARSLNYFAGIPPSFYHFIKPMIRLMFGIKTFDLYVYVDHIDKPLLLIAGENDPIVHLSEVRKIYEGSKDCVELWSTEGEHVRTIQIDLKNYEKKITSFFEEHLSGVEYEK